MTHTYHKNYYHLVWSTKERLPAIIPEHKDQMFAYLGGTLKTLKCFPLQIGGMHDHVHILTIIPPHFAVANIIRDIKISSTKWMNSLPNVKGFSWQEGYGSFTVSESQKEAVINYILNQEKHHQTRTFKDEFLELLKLHDVEYDEKYLWL